MTEKTKPAKTPQKKFKWDTQVNVRPVDNAVGKMDTSDYLKKPKVKKAKWEDRNPIDLVEVRAKLRKINKES
jgi:hypothetical protein